MAKFAKLSCRFCGHVGPNYKREPDNIVAWHQWAETTHRTHDQEPCPYCGKLTVWVKKGSRQAALDQIADRIEAGELVSEKSMSDRDFLAPILAQ